MGETEGGSGETIKVGEGGEGDRLGCGGKGPGVGPTVGPEGFS